ncbi:type VI secretion protein [Pseudomonas sp. SL4(2022)]|uniref:type VI secretion protein n=1 Tax=Pseudomonas sp. SL4(2022) TaxID=2994661 RepID=UPI0022703C2F|nr:type VI secretion protein [Pseudomonas sp. SL4(2022)]WAC44373.1 type VI secretion protein [Pseudomonas sp. SL4(2022)]
MTQGRLTPTLLALLFGLMVLLGGCSFWSERVGLSSLTLDVAERANNDTPIAVDFVAIRDPALLKLLSGITASQWFSEREQYQRDYRQLFSVWSLELVPGQFRDVREFPFSGNKASGLLVFAGYNTPGAHRLRLNESGRVWLRFDSREMRLLTDQNR